jgi:DNA-binding beta-propeller fold protein YncE
MLISRRNVLAAGAGVFAAACSHQLARRYFGWLFIASAADKGLAVADLSEFRRVTSIPLGQTPAQVFRVGKKVFVACPEGRTLFEIDPDTFHIAGRIAFPARLVAASVCPDEKSIVVLTDQPAVLHLIDAATRRTTSRIPLPGAPTGFDVSGEQAAVAVGSSVVLISLRSGRQTGVVDLGMRPGIVRLHPVAKLVLVGAADRGEIATVDSAGARLLARLPVAFTPRRFCFNSDAGQMFVTGASGDQIAIVSPWQSVVEQTIVAGSSPYGMAVGSFNGQSLLFVTNPDSGDLTIFDIDTRQHASTVHVGGKPGEVLLTPDGEYALTVDQESGDVAVVRLKTVLDRTSETRAAPMVKPLFTIFPTGQSPQSAAIVPNNRA